MNTQNKTAIILFQLGGPDSLEAVEPFLYHLFMDPDIIDFPLAFLARRPLARLISKRRARTVRNNYELIGGKSPLAELTQRQAQALHTLLTQQGVQNQVFVAMRYWHPLTEEVVREISSGGFDRIVLLPLYPQYSQATTGSSINEWRREVKKQAVNLPTQYACCYPGHPALLDALCDNINSALERFSGIPPQDIDLVFSAHGVPVRYIERGDPYQLQIEETVRRLMDRGKWRSPYTLCYQSKVGPVEWLRPSLIETVARLANTGRKYMLVIPIAFVSEHIETLHEINIEVRHRALAAGIRQFELMPALNDHPKFIACLADIVLQLLAHPVACSTCSTLWQQQKERIKPKKCPQGNV